jgi:hypothetical protein
MIASYRIYKLTADNLFSISMPTFALLKQMISILQLVY